MSITLLRWPLWREVLLAAVAAALLSLVACGDGPPEDTPPTNPPATQPPQATQEQPPEPPTAQAPGGTVEGPPGAGLIEPLHELRPETLLSDLEPGDYAVIWDLLASEEAGFELHDYAALDGGSDGPLFQIIPTSQQGAIAEVLSIEAGRVVAKSDGEGSSGGNTLLAFVDQGQQTFQFALDGEGRCRLPRPSGFLGDRYFGYHCENEDDSRQWYAVEYADWSFVGEVTLPGQVRMKGWLTPDTAYFGTPFDFNKESFQHCTAAAPNWQLQCVEYPFWLGDLNPQGTAFWAWRNEGAIYDSAPFVTSAECILELRQDCGAIEVEPPPEFWDDFTADLAAAAWAPVGRKLVTVAADCRGDRTRIWYWDFETEEHSAVAEIDGCYSLPQVGPLWDTSGSLMILETGQTDAPPFLISLDGSVIEDLPVPGAAVGVFTRP